MMLEFQLLLDFTSYKFRISRVPRLNWLGTYLGGSQPVFGIREKPGEKIGRNFFCTPFFFARFFGLIPNTGHNQLLDSKNIRQKKKKKSSDDGAKG